MQNLTCLTCRVSLVSAEQQHNHYKAEWHIYNLKRKLNQLNPLTEIEYQQLVQKHNEQSQLVNDSVENSTFYCKTCRKIFYNQKAFDQHNTSKRHLQLSSNKEEKKMTNKIENKQTETKPVQSKDQVLEIIDADLDEDFNESDWEEVDSDEEELEGIPLDECLFCGLRSENMEQNLAHMSISHSFFIPDLEYCIDIKGLLKYLGIKIASGFCCLWCSEFGKQFGSKKSTQQHMMDKGHTKMKLSSVNDEFLEFEDFYDYSTSYTKGENDNDGDDDNDQEIEPEELLADDGLHLKLPSGSIIGHRSMFVYYKQSLAPQSVERRSKNNELLNKVMGQYKALGWTGITTQQAVQRAKDIGFMHRIEQRKQLRIGKRHNLCMQPHFRSQI